MNSIDPTRRRLLHMTGGAALLAAIGQRAFAETVLDTTRIIVGFAPGGTSDTICRRLAQKLQPGFARSALVENRTGASGQLAISYVKGRPADGSVILQTPTAMLTIYPHIYKQLPYDPIADLTPLSVGCTFDAAFAVGPSVPVSVRSVPDFLAWAKANPAAANFGSPAAGSMPHFVGVLIGQYGSLDLKHVAYRGAQPAMLDLLGGNISAVSLPVGDITQHLPTGKVRILATYGAKRSRFTPDVPTLGDQGIKDMVYSEWCVFLLPAKAAPDLVERLNGHVRRAMASQDVIDGLATFGLEATSSTPEEAGEIIRSETAKWRPIVKKVGFTADS